MQIFQMFHPNDSFFSSNPLLNKFMIRACSIFWSCDRKCSSNMACTYFRVLFLACDGRRRGDPNGVYLTQQLTPIRQNRKSSVALLRAQVAQLLDWTARATQAAENVTKNYVATVNLFYEGDLLHSNFQKLTPWKVLIYSSVGVNTKFTTWRM